ncbi:hypothetical protein AJ80_09643 [Polytolypa hystricis UAMH7299]|uniref:F-box domain-containing protein n=1 Tax=Polytolypa hystricis (strain UAMH7299) TaxID=1447883 RepID=A0A2B7WM69_POLH7|nr:hypothetical protein AJ80_09643 [Polytolypa hystricis UAMH7299]
MWPREADAIVGYWEVYCQLCGVPFNIARIRTKDEPRSAAFNSWGARWVEERNIPADDDHQVDNEEAREETEDSGLDQETKEDKDQYEDGNGDENLDREPDTCSSATGCCLVFRVPKLGVRFDSTFEPAYGEENLWHGTPIEDADYEYMSPSDDELLEYDSDAATDDSPEPDGTLPNEEESCESDLNEEPEWTFRVSGPADPEYDTDFLPLSGKGRCGGSLYAYDPCDAWDRTRLFEHIAGPKCQNQEGYHSSRIPPEEMRGCHTVQCLIRKKQGWQPRADDLDFERESECHLTGVTTHMPSSGNILKFAPVRHGVNDINAESDFVLETTQEQLNEIGLPFHPTCFELYVQASRRFLGHVDIDSLIHIRDQACLARKPFPIIYHPDVLSDREQVWIHRAGHEYLSANPIFIPGLKPLLQSSISSPDENFNLSNSAFSETRPPQPQPHNIQKEEEEEEENDPFLHLPPEITQTIASHLPPKSIANLRLTSRAFTHLPISFFRHLLLREMPFLYEIWPSHQQQPSSPPPYPWSRIMARDLHAEQDARRAFDIDFATRAAVIRADMTPEAYEEWLKHEAPDAVWEWPEHPDQREMREEVEIVGGGLMLPVQRMNWFRVYRDIRRQWDVLKGLRNRERIWGCVMQIIGEVEKEVARGKKGEGGDGDV